jgi:predicted naringenin-chalcone synthase
MSVPPVLHNFRVQLPAFRGSHAEVVSWLAAAHARAEATLQAARPDPDPEFDAGAFRRQMERHLRRFAPSPETVGFRYSDLGEFLDENFGDKQLFPLDRMPQGAGTAARMDAFATMARRAVQGLYSSDVDADGSQDVPDGIEASDAPNEILHVTCTGYAAPSAVQELVEERGWQARTRVTHAYHMGCYAALPAVRIAVGYVGGDVAAHAASPGNPFRCDIVHTELCSLHLNPARHDPEQLVVQSLFSDGFIRYSLSPGGSEDAVLDGFELLGTAERLIPDSLVDIGWAPGDFGMRMSLSRNVPDKVGPHLDGFVTALAQECGMTRGDLDGAVYAVHPGGPRIVDKVEEWLRLVPSQVRASREILFERGNMSSATLPHIWERLLHDPSVQDGALVVSLAFGPGLTLYGSLMKRSRSGSQIGDAPWP